MLMEIMQGGNLIKRDSLSQSSAFHYPNGCCKTRSTVGFLIILLPLPCAEYFTVYTMYCLLFLLSEEQALFHDKRFKLQCAASLFLHIASLFLSCLPPYSLFLCVFTHCLCLCPCRICACQRVSWRTSWGSSMSK